MGKKKDLTPRKRAQLAILVKEEYKSVDIARKLDLSKAAVSKLRKKLRNGESISPKKKNSGRQKATTAREDGIMRREVLKNRRMTSTKLQQNMQNHGVNVSARTIRRRLLMQDSSGDDPGKNRSSLQRWLKND